MLLLSPPVAAIPPATPSNMQSDSDATPVPAMLNTCFPPLDSHPSRREDCIATQLPPRGCHLRGNISTRAHAHARAQAQAHRGSSQAGPGQAEGGQGTQGEKGSQGNDRSQGVQGPVARAGGARKRWGRCGPSGNGCRSQNCGGRPASECHPSSDMTRKNNNPGERDERWWE